MEYIREFGKAERRDINILINDKLPEYMTDRQRYDKITTLLSALKRKKFLYITVNIGYL